MGTIVGVVDIRPDGEAAIEDLVGLARRFRGQSGQQAEMPSYRYHARRRKPSADDLAVELAIRRRIKAIDQAAGVHYPWHDRVPNEGPAQSGAPRNRSGGDLGSPTDDGTAGPVRGAPEPHPQPARGGCPPAVGPPDGATLAPARGPAGVLLRPLRAREHRRAGRRRWRDARS